MNWGWWLEGRLFAALGVLLRWRSKRPGYRIAYVMLTKDNDIYGCYWKFDTAATFNNKNPVNRKCKIAVAYIREADLGR